MDFNQDLVFVLLIISFFLIAVLKHTYYKHTILLLKGVFARRYANQFLREDNVFTERVNIITFLLLTINFSIVLINVLNIESLFDVFILFLTIGAFYFLKVRLIILLGKLFLLKELSEIAVFFSFLFERVISIIIYPILVLLSFFYYDITQFFLILIGVIVVSILLIKFFWLWNIGVKSFGVSNFYIFLYLCLFEIFPFLLVIKLVI